MRTDDSPSTHSPKELLDISLNGCGWKIKISHKSFMVHCFWQPKEWILSVTALQTLQYPELACLLIGALKLPDAVLLVSLSCVWDYAFRPVVHLAAVCRDGCLSLPALLVCHGYRKDRSDLLITIAIYRRLCVLLGARLNQEEDRWRHNRSPCLLVIDRLWGNFFSPLTLSIISHGQLWLLLQAWLLVCPN